MGTSAVARLYIAVQLGLGELTKGIKQVESKLKGMENALARTGSRMSLAFTVPLATMGATATQAFAAFDKALVDSIAKMDKSEKSITGLRNSMAARAKEVGQAFNIFPAEVAQGFKSLVQAGYSSAEVMKNIGVVAQFAKAGEMDMAAAAQMLATAQTAMKMKTDDAALSASNMARIANVLVAADLDGTASVEDFAQALGSKLAGSIRLTGMQLEDAVSGLVAFAKSGIRGRDAATQLSIVLRDVQIKALKNATAFKEAGIAIFDINKNMRPLPAIIKSFEDKMTGMSSAQKTAFLMSLGFTQKNIDALKALVGYSQEMAEFAEKAKRLGLTNEIAAEKMKSFSEAIMKLRVALNLVSIEIGGKLAPYIELFGNAIVGLLKVFTGLNPKIQEFVIIFGAIVAIAGPAAFILSALIASLSPLAIAIAVATTALIVFRKEIASGVLNYIFKLKVAIAITKKEISDFVDGVKRFISDAITTIGQYTERIRKLFSNIPAKIKEAFILAMPGPAAFFFRLVEMAEKALAKILNMFPSFSKTLNSLFSKLGENIFNNFEKALDSLGVFGLPLKAGFAAGKAIFGSDSQSETEKAFFGTISDLLEKGVAGIYGVETSASKTSDEFKDWLKSIVGVNEELSLAADQAAKLAGAGGESFPGVPDKKGSKKAQDEINKTNKAVGSLDQKLSKLGTNQAIKDLERQFQNSLNNEEVWDVAEQFRLLGEMADEAAVKIHKQYDDDLLRLKGKISPEEYAKREGAIEARAQEERKKVWAKGLDDQEKAEDDHLKRLDDKYKDLYQKGAQSFQDNMQFAAQALSQPIEQTFLGIWDKVGTSMAASLSAAAGTAVPSIENIFIKLGDYLGGQLSGVLSSVFGLSAEAGAGLGGGILQVLSMTVGALSGSNSVNKQSKSEKGTGQTVGTIAGAGAGLAIGASMETILGMAGGPAGMVIGAMAGQMLGGAVGGMFKHGPQDPETKARHAFAGWFEEQMKALSRVTFFDAQGKLQTTKSKNFNLLERRGDFSGDWAGKFASMDKDAQAAFSGIGAAMKELSGITEEEADKISYMLSEAFSGNIDNARLLVRQLGYSLEDMTAAIEKLALKGEITWAEYNRDIAGLNDAFKDGLQAAQAYGEAFDEIIGSGGRGQAAIKGVRDIIVEAKEAGITTTEALKQALLAQGKPAEEVNAIITAIDTKMKEKGFTKLEDLLGLSDTEIGSVVGKMEGLSKSLADQWAKMGDDIESLKKKIEDIPTDVKTNFRFYVDAEISDDARKVLDSQNAVAIPTGPSSSSAPKGAAGGGLITGPGVLAYSGGIGRVGESGAEWVLPVARVGGKLGVRATGMPGGGSVVNITVDARNADAGVEARIRRLIPQIQQAATNAALSAISKRY